jgi:parallel beta-helix repeat protein
MKLLVPVSIVNIQRNPINGRAEKFHAKYTVQVYTDPVPQKFGGELMNFGRVTFEIAGPVLLSLTVVCHAAAAKVLCVNPNGTLGCYAHIQSAVNAAAAGDLVLVAAGTYAEDVTIGKSLTLIGAGSTGTIINAAGLANGIFVDGIDNSGLAHVTILGFTVENANFEGILVVNSSYVTISNNHVIGNDLSLNVQQGMCPGQPVFETDEGDDCGEGIHIMGVSHSTIENNLSQNNSGGMLISDDTGSTFGNTIKGNTVSYNPYDCGITMASHPPALGSHAPHNGIHDNTVVLNISILNGGAGIGMFSDGTGPGLMSGNIVDHNQSLDNALPGVAMHSHVGGDTFQGNQITNNYLSGNKADQGDTATSGPAGINVNSGFGTTPISGTVITGNTVENETIDVAINTPTTVNLHFNNLLGGNTGVDNISGQTVNAVENWWGCTGGPGATGCSSITGSVDFTPWSMKQF